jgi:hypothetical protein
LASSLSFNHLWTSEGKTFELLRLLDDVVRIQISSEPDKNNYGKQYKSRPIFHGRKEGQQKNPKGDIIGYPDQNKWMCERLFD